MAVPQDYMNASRDFDLFMDDFMEISMLATHHQAYAVLRAVLHVFRSQLTVEQVARFADALPPVLRAIVLEDWRPSDNASSLPDETPQVTEVRAIRRDRSLATETSIHDVARALRRHVHMGDFRRALDPLPPRAQRFWLD
jgi:uncharacterized protein (DUF2267 family)